MTYEAEVDELLADFGVACSKTGTNFTGILDAGDEQFPSGQVGVVAAEHTLTYKTSAVALAYNDAISVGGVAYTVHEVTALDDGAITRARIGRT